MDVKPPQTLIQLNLTVDPGQSSTIATIFTAFAVNLKGYLAHLDQTGDLIGFLPRSSQFCPRTTTIIPLKPSVQHLSPFIDLLDGEDPENHD